MKGVKGVAVQLVVEEVAVVDANEIVILEALMVSEVQVAEQTGPSRLHCTMVVLLQAQYHRGATWGNQLSFFFWSCGVKG